jgi:hypothetical protein
MQKQTKLIRLSVNWSDNKLNIIRDEFDIISETPKLYKLNNSNRPIGVSYINDQINKQHDLDKINGHHYNSISSFSYTIITTPDNEDNAKQKLNDLVNSIVKKSSDSVLALAEYGSIFKL